MSDLSKRSLKRVFLYIFKVTEETMDLVIHRDCVKPLYIVDAVVFTIVH